MKKLTITNLKESYQSLCEESVLDFDYLFLLIISSIICFFGFKMNSPAIIIGSMVICPLLYSIIGVSASIFFLDLKQFIKEILSLLLEFLLIFLIIFSLSKLFDIPISTEITSRLELLNIDYFFVALLSGIAAAFTLFWPKGNSSLVGIAISVALIPPLVLSGIGIGIGDSLISTSSFSIVLVNLLGILVGSLLTLIFFKISTKFNKRL